MLTLPLAVLDFEASSLGSDSYPIEVGVAIVPRIDAEVETHSMLIQRRPDWTDWDRKAERVHGIPIVALTAGFAAAEVLTRLNDLLAPVGHAWCDGGAYDQFWFKRLCKAAPLVRPAFALFDIMGLFALDRRAHNRFADALAKSVAPHRAGPDAARVCVAIIKATVEKQNAA